jgi:hypothetical protein
MRSVHTADKISVHLASPARVVGRMMSRSDRRVHGKTLNWIAPVGNANTDVDSAPRSNDAALRGIDTKMKNVSILDLQCKDSHVVLLVMRKSRHKPADVPRACSRVLIQSTGKTTICAQARATAPEIMSVAKLPFFFDGINFDCAPNEARDPSLIPPFSKVKDVT